MDKRTLWCMVRQDGALCACDDFCDKYHLNWLFSPKHRYNTLYKFLLWYGRSDLGRWLNRNIYDKEYKWHFHNDARNRY
jgi:hypothetical protein